MDNKRDEEKQTGINRRRFIGALGAAAAAGAFLERGGGHAEAATSANVMYLDSFGNIVPASPQALAVGSMPPPLPPAGDQPDESGTYVTPGYDQPNILMIMVDQMRAPRWVPADWQTPAGFQYYMPHIYALQNQAYVFANFFAAATACTPCRATVLTGLYSQQTCIFNTLSFNQNQPTLIPLTYSEDVPNLGYPSIGNVLSQTIPNGTPYSTVWIGKWHLSANNPQGSGGPTAYGFNDTEYCIPNTGTNLYEPNMAYPSPDGSPNEGAEGILLSGTPPLTGQGLPAGETWNTPDDNLEDGAIADAFVNTWLPHAEKEFASTPWFAAVSFVNPHDTSHFPYAYGLNVSESTDFATPPSPPTAGYEIPPTLGYDLSEKSSDEYIPALPTAYPATASGTPPTGPLPGESYAWNNEDNPANQPYGTFVSGPQGYGKPTEQHYFQYTTDQMYGAILSPNPDYPGSGLPGWFTFLNYYLWMQSCVDDQVGRVITALQGSQFAGNTVIVFFADHGDYGGSHYMHRKGGGLYDEVINVPLYIQTPGQLAPQVVVPNLCSTVDILPFLYFLILGNDSWRNNLGDLVYYLRTRESIADFMFSSTPQQRRLSSIPLLNPPLNGQTMQPYVLHTCDEDLAAHTPPSGPAAPSHAIAFRTVDLTVNGNVPPLQPPYGGGKLGIYSYWPSPCPQSADAPPSPSQTQPITPPGFVQEFEFYFYSPNDGTLSPNPAEIGNQAFSGVNESAPVWYPEAQAYNESFNAIVDSELYAIPTEPYVGNAYNNGAWSVAGLGTFLTYSQTVLDPGGCPS